MICRYADMAIRHAMMTEGRQDWVQDVRNISNNGLGCFQFMAYRHNGITAYHLGNRYFYGASTEKIYIFYIYIYYNIYKYSYYTTLLHAPYHISEKTKWFAGLPVCRYAINN